MVLCTWPTINCSARRWAMKLIHVQRGWQSGLSALTWKPHVCHPPPGVYQGQFPYCNGPLLVTILFPTLSLASSRITRTFKFPACLFSLTLRNTYRGYFFLHFIHKLRFFFIVEEGLGFLGTMVLSTPPALGTPRPSTDGQIVLHLVISFIKSNDVVFMEDSGSIKDDVEMHLSGRNGGLSVVVMVNKSCKSPLFDGGGQTVYGNKQVGGNGIAIEQSRGRAENNDTIVERKSQRSNKELYEENSITSL